MIKLGDIINFFWKGYSKKGVAQRDDIKFTIRVIIFVILLIVGTWLYFSR